MQLDFIDAEPKNLISSVPPNRQNLIYAGLFIDDRYAFTGRLCCEIVLRSGCEAKVGNLSRDAA